MIANNIISWREKLPQNVTLVAVSKTKPIEDITAAYHAGQRIFGENKIQEMTQKQEALPKDIKWHMIGHVQTNKVKYMIPYVALIHSVDRIKLLDEINKQAQKHQRIVDILIQVKIATEDTKYGMPIEETLQLFTGNTLANYTHINIKGLMGMASFSQDQLLVENEFKKLNRLFIRFRESEHINNLSNVNLELLSMGMSGDYDLAIANGSTMVRVGSAIFGNRNYQH